MVIKVPLVHLQVLLVLYKVLLALLALQSSFGFLHHGGQIQVATFVLKMAILLYVAIIVHAKKDAFIDFFFKHTEWRFVHFEERLNGVSGLQKLHSPMVTYHNYIEETKKKCFS